METLLVVGADALVGVALWATLWHEYDMSPLIISVLTGGAIVLGATPTSAGSAVGGASFTAMAGDVGVALLVSSLIGAFA